MTSFSPAPQPTDISSPKHDPYRPVFALRTGPDPIRAPVAALCPLHDKSIPPLPRSSFKAFISLPTATGFTLVELLAVIGIMGLLAAVAVPALKGLTGSGGRKQALSQLMGALEIARNTAISTGTNAAVIFPNSNSDTFFGGTTNPYRYRSMAVVAWNPTNTNTPPTMVGSWIVLPQGVAFFPIYLSTNNLPTATNISVRILTSSKTTDFSAIVFQPDGGLSEDYSPFPTNGIAFFEGKVDEDGKTNLTSKMTNFETVRLTRYTGRAIPILAPAP